MKVTDFAEEFKVYENMFSQEQNLIEWKLMPTADQKAQKVYIWDMYVDLADKGTWTSAELYRGEWDGYVYETEKAALDGGWSHLQELEDEGELRGEPDDYTVEAVAIPLSEVPTRTLAFSSLDHLI